jgi:hypothetical protein
MANIAFSHKLVLNRFFLSLFGGHPYDLGQDTFREVTKRLTDESLELREEDGVSRFLEELERMLPSTGPLKYEQLHDYDQNIARHTKAINARRILPIQWKYFQYLTLLFTEIYLDWYFRDADGLLNELNQHLESFNNALLEWGERKKDTLTPYTSNSLRKLAFWNATGSGKTLLMHVNLAQYRHYLAKYKRTGELNRIMVLTPNEGLTHQHLEEFKQSGIVAAPFDKNSTGNSTGMFRGQIVDVIDMNKLREEGKRKTVSVDQFETNNLVFIDEAHRGSQGEVWSEMRNRLAKDGFTFEYSATIGQAVSSDTNSADEYAKSILFDYSYRYFHADGFGKDYQILNIEGKEDSQVERERRQLYLTACLLSFYQQLKLYENQRFKYKPFAIEKPLWVFVGSKVTAVRTENRKQVSDVVDILLFLAEFVSDQHRKNTTAQIKRLLSGDTGLLDNKNCDIFAEAFPYLQELGLSVEETFSDILGRLFNAPSGGALHVEYLTGGDGELALRLGTTNEPFGVINVGDAKKVAELCDEHSDSLFVSEKTFNSSLFRTLNDKDSKLNILIGSKRFSEGWNSYRVSTLGLMYVGQNEGSEIIQLFGRGVRLRGYAHSLKRSRAIHWAARNRELDWVAKDHLLPILETLNVFGVKSDYMARFNEFLEGEGICKPDDRESITIPVRLNRLPSVPLITVRIPDNINFKKEQKTTLGLSDEIKLKAGDIELDWYPRIASKASKGIRQTRLISSLHRQRLEDSHLAFMDFDSIYLQLQQLKAERSWHNLNLSRETAKLLLSAPNNDWYIVYAPKETFDFDRFEKVDEWEEIAVALLKKYCDRFYKAKKDAYEAPFREYKELDPGDPNFISEYKVMVDQSEKLIIQRLNELERNIRDGLLSDFNIGGRGEAVFFEQHLYSPMLHLRKGVDTDLFNMSPVPLNEGERDFVIDLRTYFQSKPALIEGKEIYLLRNQSKGRGVGFFEAGNFYPDFMLWILDADRQHVVFVDPKGILRCEGINDPKLKFFETIKTIEQSLALKDPARAGKIFLHSFVVSNTPLGKIRWWDPSIATEEEFAKRNVLFQREAGNRYIETLFQSALS